MRNSFIVTFVVLSLSSGLFCWPSSARADSALAPEAAASGEAVSPLETAPVEEEVQTIDDTLLEMILQEPKMCCLAESVKPAAIHGLAGLLFWRRIRILCRGVRPTAIC